ncbi:MAG: deoxyribose-phosphate aldolase [Pseudomonadota bacterium]|nr:deoxyribose-phosphate aldolase [Pseudomonadota bacterium]
MVITPALARRTLAALDLTCLDEDASPDRIEALCRAAHGRFGDVAAVCVYPEYITSARRSLIALGASAIRVATVTNFPDGSDDPARAVRETRRAVAAGADEVDVVFPWRALLDGYEQPGRDLVGGCREACGERAKLKVILETGHLAGPALIRQASEVAIAAGADFIKTSTGKAAVNATSGAAVIMLKAIRDHGGECGFKAAGGIRRLSDAARYFDIADRMLGPGWATPERFRIGASSLVDEVLEVLGEEAPSTVDAGY